MLLAKEIIDERECVWDLRREKIVKEFNDLIRCVGVLVNLNIKRKKEEDISAIQDDEFLINSLTLAFEVKYPLLEVEDYKDIVEEFGKQGGGK